MGLKGVFSDGKKKIEYDTFGIYYLEEEGQWELKFLKAHKSIKDIREIGNIKIPHLMAKAFAKVVFNYVPKNKPSSLSDGWSEHLKKMKDNPPSELLIKAVKLIGAGKGRKALDLGSGSGVDTKYLVSKGYSVTAVDISPSAGGYLKNIPHEKVFFVNMPFEEYKFPVDKYDVVNAQWSLPHVRSEMFKEVMEGIKKSLKVGGVFTGLLLGKGDDLAYSGLNMSFVSLYEVGKLFKDWEIIELREEEYDKEKEGGKKRHTHEIHVISRKL